MCDKVSSFEEDITYARKAQSFERRICVLEGDLARVIQFSEASNGDLQSKVDTLVTRDECVQL